MAMADVLKPMDATTAVQYTVDFHTFVEYIKKIIPLLFDDKESNLKGLTAAISDKQNVEIIKKFINDPQAPCLLFQRAEGKGG